MLSPLLRRGEGGCLVMTVRRKGGEGDGDGEEDDIAEEGCRRLFITGLRTVFGCRPSTEQQYASQLPREGMEESSVGERGR